MNEADIHFCQLATTTKHGLHCYHWMYGVYHERIRLCFSVCVCVHMMFICSNFYRNANHHSLCVALSFSSAASSYSSLSSLLFLSCALTHKHMHTLSSEQIHTIFNLFLAFFFLFLYFLFSCLIHFSFRAFIRSLAFPCRSFFSSSIQYTSTSE